MKNFDKNFDISAGIAVLLLILNIFIVYFGRIHYPLNFHPDTVSFWENYWVLGFGEAFGLFLIVICLLGLYVVGCGIVTIISWLISGISFVMSIMQNIRFKKRDNTIQKSDL